jgi:signal transduction histidine kinase
VTFQRKLLLGVSLMVLPALLVGTEAIRSNVLEQRALATLGERLGRSRTYAELETAMFNQSEVIWRYLTGLDPEAKKEFGLYGEVVHYWFERWKAELAPADSSLARQVADLQQQFVAVGENAFQTFDAGRHQEAYRVAQAELRTRLQPALTALNRQIYRRTRESSVQGAYARVEAIVGEERRTLVGIFLLSVAAGLVSAWMMARGLVRPINELRGAMAVVGAGKLDHPITARSDDEIGDLARAFSSMTDSLRQSQSEMVRLNDELAGKVSQLERAQAQLVQSEKLASIGEMSAAVAHGLRNPLASLRASAQLVLKHPGSPAAAEQLRAILDEVDRLDRRITHLLAFSRPAPFRPIPERLANLVQEVLPAFGDRLKTQRVTLELNVPADLPQILADTLKVEQALVELLSNALDAMPGGGRLSLRACPARGPAGSNGVVIELTDTGGGIPAETLASVGQPFFTTRPEGTGLGVATARRFVEQHGGLLDLISREGEGTTVRIWLPAA